MALPLPRRGILVAIEGIDGAGKTTQAGLLGRSLSGAGFEVLNTKEPTDRTEHGRRIRASATSGRLALAQELEAFVEDRREHVASLINPALAAGKVVIVDRYYFSTAAYQGARGGDVAEIIALNESFAPVPDLLIHLDVEPMVGLSRISDRGDSANAFEHEDNLRRCGQIFRSMDLPYLMRFDGRETIKELSRLILLAVWEGPLRDRLCGDGRTVCEPAWCVQRQECPHPKLYNSLDLGSRQEREILERFAQVAEEDSAAAARLLNRYGHGVLE